jgi:hypothetical protein
MSNVFTDVISHNPYCENTPFNKGSILAFGGGRAAVSVDKGCKCVLLREAREIGIRQSSRLVGDREP